MSSHYTIIRYGKGPPEVREAYASVWKWHFHELSQHFAYCLARARVAADVQGTTLKMRETDRAYDLKAAKVHRRRERSVFRDVQLDDFRSQRGDTPMSLAADEMDMVKSEPCTRLGSVQEPRVEDVDDTGMLEEPETHAMESTPYITPPASPQHTTGEVFSIASSPLARFQSNTPPLLLFRSVGSESAGRSEENIIVSGRHAPFPRRPIHVCEDPETLIDDAEFHIGRHEVHSPYLR